MANIQEDVTSQAWNLILKFLGSGAEFTYQMTHEGVTMVAQGGNFCANVLLALINKQKEIDEPTDAASKMLLRVQNGESINTMLVAEEDAVVFKRYLDEHKILYNVVENAGDDALAFMYMSNDAKKINDILLLFHADAGRISEIDTDLFLDNFASEGIGTLSGLDRADLEVFRNYAEKNHLVFSSTKADDSNNYMIIYDPKDADKVKKTMASTIWAFSGERGERYKKQMVVYLKNRQTINRSLTEGEKEFYIVNAKSPEQYVFLTANDLTYYKNSKEILNVSRSSSDFLDRSLRTINGMALPVILSRDEFELFKEDGEKDKEAVDTVVNAKATNIPILLDLLKIQDEQNDKLEKIQNKLALDDEGTAGFWIYDDSIGFETSASYEEVEDLDDQIKADMVAARNNARSYRFYEVENIDSRNIDYLIAEAEKHREETREETHSFEREM